MFFNFQTTDSESNRNRTQKARKQQNKIESKNSLTKTNVELFNDREKTTLIKQNRTNIDVYLCNWRWALSDMKISFHFASLDSRHAIRREQLKRDADESTRVDNIDTHKKINIEMNVAKFPFWRRRACRCLSFASRTKWKYKFADAQNQIRFLPLFGEM